MSEKITCGDIYKDFKTRLPTWAKLVVDYRPYDYMTIVVYFADGSRMLYDGLQKLPRLLVTA